MTTKPEVRGFWTVNVDQPWRQPVHVMCEVRIGAKQINLVAMERVSRWTWQDRRIFIYGSSAFGTLGAAHSRRRYLMRKIITDGWSRENRHDVWSTCCTQLAYERKYG